MRTLITGADGCLGRRLAGCMEDPIRWGRSRGDLTEAEPFRSVDPSEIGAIVHAAAVTRFNVDAETADAVNVEGTRKVVAFARRCPKLKSLVVLSTLYVSGLRPGPVEERRLERPEFANHYERSKWEAEALLPDDLPWRIVRPATVMADDETGEVTRPNAVHNTLKLFYYGLLSMLPGEPSTPLCFVTTEEASAAVRNVARHGRDHAVTHVAREPIALGDLIDLTVEAFWEDPAFRRRRILRPVFVDRRSFELLVDGINSFGGGIVKQAVSSIAPFAPQLFVSKDVCRGSLADVPRSGIRELCLRTCGNLVRTKWGACAG